MVEVKELVKRVEALVSTGSFPESNALVANDGLITLTIVINVLFHILVLASIGEHVIDLRDNCQSNEVHDDIHHSHLLSN